MRHMLNLMAVAFSFLLLCCGQESASINKEGYLTGADGAKLYFRVLGSNADTVVVIHGGPGAGMNSILPSLEGLSRSFVLIFYDQRGGGQSELPTDTSKLQASYFVKDLEAVQSHFRLSKMNVIAHSFGSILIAEYAQKYSNHLNRVLLHGATGPRRSEAARIYRKQAAATPDSTLLNQSFSVLQELLSGTAADPVASCREYEKISRELAISRGETGNLTGSTCLASVEAVRYYYRYTAQLAPASFGDWDYTAKLAHVSSPLLVIYGQKDTLALASQLEWVKAVENGRLLLVPEAWKGALADNQDFTFEAIEAFFHNKWPEGSQNLESYQ